MKHYLLLACMIISSSIASVCAQETQRYEINVGDFDKLVVTDDLNVKYVCDADSAGMIVFDATAEAKNSLLYTRKGTKLLLQMSSDYAIANRKMPDITIYSSRIEELENKGHSHIFVKGVESAEKVKLTLTDNGTIEAYDIVAPEVDAKIFTGKGTIVVTGKCDKANLRCTGTGEVRAEHLEAKEVGCMLLGTGVVRCWVNGGKLVTKGSGPGRVYFRGTPSEIKSYHLGRLKTIPYTEDDTIAPKDTVPMYELTPAEPIDPAEEIEPIDDDDDTIDVIEYDDEADSDTLQYHEI